MASGRAREAAALLAALDRDEPRLAGVPERLAAALLASGRATEGDAVLRAAGARGSGTARVRLAARLMQSARAPEAAALLEQALRDGLRPRDARDAAAILAEAGGARLDAGDPEGAVRAYRSAIRAGVATEEAFANLALALVRQGRDGEAAAALREGLRQLPRSTLLAERLDELGD